MSQLSESEFKSIVDAVAADRSRIVSVVAGGFGVTLMVLSRRRKQTWQASCDFDPLTGNYSCRSMYPSSVELRSFAAEVTRRIRGG